MTKPTDTKKEKHRVEARLRRLKLLRRWLMPGFILTVGIVAVALWAFDIPNRIACHRANATWHPETRTCQLPSVRYKVTIPG